MTKRNAGPADQFLSETCEYCYDRLFVGAHIAKDERRFCNEECRKKWHRLKRRVVWETHPPFCACTDCM